MALMTLDVTAKVMDYRQTEQDFRLGGFHEHNPILSVWGYAYTRTHYRR